MEDKFRYTSTGDILCKTPSGSEFIVARASDAYWADAITYALNFTRREEFC